MGAVVGAVQITGGVTITTGPAAPVVSNIAMTFDTSLNTNGPVYVALGTVGESYTVNAVINWGDGNTTLANGLGTYSHTYSSAGSYNVTVGGIVERFGDDGTVDKTALVSVSSWDNAIGLKNISRAFYNAINLTTVPTTLPSDVSNINAAFMYAGKFNGDISAWNTSNVIDMGSTFAYASNFNGNISSWNTSSVTNMSFTFQRARSFNQNIGTWNTSNVTSMFGTFQGANTFNQNLSSWNTGNVTTMRSMFEKASAFNGNVVTWNTSKVATMYWMFEEATNFNQNIGSWNTANVQVMTGMFLYGTNFNGNIGTWNTTKVTSMDQMFGAASAFNQNLSSWCVANIPTKPFEFDIDATAWVGGNAARPQWGAPCV